MEFQVIPVSSHTSTTLSPKQLQPLTKPSVTPPMELDLILLLSIEWSFIQNTKAGLHNSSKSPLPRQDRKTHVLRNTHSLQGVTWAWNSSLEEIREDCWKRKAVINIKRGKWGARLMNYRGRSPNDQCGFHKDKPWKKYVISMYQMPSFLFSHSSWFTSLLRYYKIFLKTHFSTYSFSCKTKRWKMESCVCI